MRILVTGGAGFIGTRLTGRLLREEPLAEICVVDNLLAQVHGESPLPPIEHASLRFVRADIRDREAMREVVNSFLPTHVVHLAAETGTNQSMDEVVRYCDVNVTGMALILEELARSQVDLRRFVLSSSRAVYGEGPWRHPDGRIVTPDPRRSDDMAMGDFLPRVKTEKLLEPLPVSEEDEIRPASVYASTKLMQEFLLRQSRFAKIGAIFRLQNVYGPGQSLKNPYTGVLSIFCQQLLNGKVLDIFEDGAIVRDFIFVDDVVTGLMAGIRLGIGDCATINLGSGVPTTILQVARVLCEVFALDPRDRVRVSGRFRDGDIRHACANIERARDILGWVPRTEVKQGLQLLAKWSRSTLGS